MPEAREKTLKGKLLQEAVAAHFCDDCGGQLAAGDYITHTLDMRRMWHTACFEASLAPFKDSGCCIIRTQVLYVVLARQAEMARKLREDDEGKLKFFAGAAFGSFDGEIQEVDLRGNLQRVKLILTAGGAEIDCVLRGFTLEQVRAVLGARVWAEGEAVYSGESGLPVRIEITKVAPIKPTASFRRWKGSFAPSTSRAEMATDETSVSERRERGMNDLAAVIQSIYGERCSRREGGCTCCAVWAIYDALDTMTDASVFAGDLKMTEKP